ncbi:exosortase 1 [Burkholderiales bacterium JOSHI_001]|nr:exosortase 1 [Burkholderiales bacterium JOSHI_001]
MWPGSDAAASGGVHAAAASAAWRSALPTLALTLALTLLLYWRTASEMAGIWWRSDTFAHALLVPPLVVWLVWRQRNHLKFLVPRPSAGALAIVALAAALWWAGDLVQSNVVTQFALVTLCVAAVPVVLGWRVARSIWFPLAFAYFAVPAGEALVPLLMEGTADFTVAALRVSGIPVYREGLNFVIPSGNWSVVEACSGVRYLIASFMVGTLFAFLVYRSTGRRLAFMGVSLLVPILANWVRAYLIVLVGHLSSNRIATGVDHLIYGWVFFGLVMMITYWVGARWAEDNEAPTGGMPALLETVPAPSIGRQVVLAAALVATLAWPVAMQWKAQLPLPEVQPLALPGDLPGGWQADPAAGVGWQPLHTKPLTQTNRQYRLGDHRVGLDLAYYRQQDRGRKVVSSSNVLVGEGDPRWQVQPMAATQLPWRDGLLELRVSRLINRVGDRPDQLVWQTYWVDGGFTADDMQARLRLALGVIRGHGDAAARITVHTDLDDPQAAAQRLRDFMQAAMPALRVALGSAGGGQP